jgi:hypothetical protein
MRDGTDQALAGEFMEFTEYQKFIGMDTYISNQTKYVFE